MAHYGSSFIIERLALDASIGLLDHERAHKQPVAISVRLYFPSLPDCTGNDAGTFIDYASLSNKLTGLVESQHFQLIEYMAHELFKTARAYVDAHGGQKVAIWLKLNKCQPTVRHMVDGASFVLSDLPADATVVPQ